MNLKETQIDITWSYTIEYFAKWIEENNKLTEINLTFDSEKTTEPVTTGDIVDYFYMVMKEKSFVEKIGVATLLKSWNQYKHFKDYFYFELIKNND